ncbi:MAG: cytochrome c maturation protein CcmE [Armatimonadetes bacterium]|nr:cytochrome c maturation protein CcmE [Armatimonadota bacterium]MCX7968405.1 cytochrome c maturation protein CcmE [Armatimonadota bacterium]MDW8143805.1 cytochrome c maturation protein CcmE [Armatimonadota bacterium]
MREQRWKLFALVGLLGLLVYAGYALFSSGNIVQPYVTFEEAKKMTGTVRVAVHIDHKTRTYDHETGALEFTAQDTKGAKCKVRLNPNFVPPAGFEQTPMAVVIGRYKNGIFEADRMFLKCPSKYEGHQDVIQHSDKTAAGR